MLIYLLGPSWEAVSEGGRHVVFVPPGVGF